MFAIRLLFLVSSLFLSQASLAQQLIAKKNFYVLVDSPAFRHRAIIRNIDDKEITIKEAGGQNRIIPKVNILSFGYNNRTFQAIENFYVKPANSTSLVRRAFVELLDSGRVSLFSYYYTRATLMPLLVSGTILPGIGSSSQTLYLLRDNSTQQVTTIPADDLMNLGGGQSFRGALQPFLLKRPDLLNPLMDKHLHVEDLPDIIRALNSNKPFVRTNRTPFGVD